MKTMLAYNSKKSGEIISFHFKSCKRIFYIFFLLNGLMLWSLGVTNANAQTQPQPTNTLSILSYGARTNLSDNTTAIQNCINAAQTAGKGVWIPAGTYTNKGTLNATGILIAGAGMTNSIIYRQQNSTDITATQIGLTSCTFQDIGIDGNGISRGTNASYGINIKGVGWLIERVQIHHSDAGIWASGSSGTCASCVMLQTFADGININNAGNTPNTAGANLTIQNCSQDGAGDDGFAINAQGEDSGWPNMANPQILNCTSLDAFYANGIRIAGGSNSVVESCLISNTTHECGIEVSSYGSGGFGVTNGLIEGNTIYGSGTSDASACIGTGDARTTATFIGNTLINSAGAGFQIGTPTYPNAGNIVFGPNNVIINPAGSGIAIQSGVVGSGLFITNTVMNLKNGQSPFINGSSTFIATLMGNNWQGTIIPAAPTDLTATAADSQVGLHWAAPPSGNIASNATSYSIWRSLTNGGPYAMIASNVTTLIYNDSNLNNGTTYYYVVTSANGAGESADSVQADASPKVISSNIAFTSGNITNDSVLGLAGPPVQELYGVSLGNGVAQTTGNGYTFGSYPNANISYNSGQAYVGFLSGGGTSGDAGLDTVLNNGELGLSSGTLVLTNLAAGATYYALFLEADTRNVGARSFTITSGGISSSAQSYAYVGGSPFLGGYVLCTFTATQPTQTFVNTQGSYGYQLNGLLVATVFSVSTNSPTLSYGIANGMMEFNWPSDHTGWRLEAQTNSPGAGLGTNWFTMSNSSMTNQLTIPINSTNGSVFFRLIYP
jgi:hypothetical protein